MDEERFDAVVGLLYEAAMQPERWKPALLALSEAVGCNTGQLVFWDKPAKQPFFSSVSRDEVRDADQQYIEHFAAIDPRTAIIKELPNGVWFNDADQFDGAYVRKSEIYQDFLLPWDLQWTLGARFDVSVDSEALFAILRSPDQEKFGEKEMHFLKRLNPHLQRATQIQERLFQSEAKAAIGASAMHRFEHPLLITDKQGRALFCNKAAESLMRSSTMITLLQGQLALPSAADRHVLNHLLDAAVTRRQGGEMRLRRGGGSDDLHLVIIPLAPDLGADNPWERPLAMVLVLDGRSKRKFDRDDGELRVAAGLAALDRISSGIVLFAAGGSVVFANTAARKIFAEADGLKLFQAEGSQRLLAHDAEADRRLADALAAALDHDSIEASHFARCVGVPRRSRALPYSVQFSALPASNEFGHGSGAPQAIAFITDCTTPMRADAAQLQQVFGLTPAEARAALALSDGGSLEETAAGLGVSTNTLKSQLSGIYQKTGVDSRAKLVKLMLALAGVNHAP